MQNSLSRTSVAFQIGVLVFALLAASAFAAAVVARSLLLSRTLSETRSVADMAGHIATWASQYGGVSVRVKGASDVPAGTYLERHLYAQASDLKMFSGASLTGPDLDRASLSNLEAYYTKNPALVQREISDIAAVSPSLAKFRITAKTVLNRKNAPNAFESEAIAVIENTGQKEYSKLVGSRFLYARSLVASDSCLRCHDTPIGAPDFIRSNPQFNGGGGYGYKVGAPVGIISVSVPAPVLSEALAHDVSADAWSALLLPMIVLAVMCAYISLRWLLPLRRLRQFSDELTHNIAAGTFQMPEYNGYSVPHASNEVNRLEHSIVRLGSAMKYLVHKFVNERSRF